jgi:type II secretory pathway predicted ATPase ExeA
MAAFRFDDPFGPSANPARYVPRDETERALAQLEARSIGERRCALFAGVPGIGKTLLLRILRGRYGASTRVVHLRYPALPAPALFAWALQDLDEPGSYDPVGALAGLAAQAAAGGGEIVLLVDDAETLPEDAANALVLSSRETGGALRFVAAGDRAKLGGLASQMQENDPILLVDAMSAEQTDAYIQAHLAAGGLAGAAHEPFGSEAIQALHRATAGIPSRVNAEASRLLRRALGPRFIAPAAIVATPRPSVAAPVQADAAPAPSDAAPVPAVTAPAPADRAPVPSAAAPPQLQPPAPRVAVPPAPERPPAPETPTPGAASAPDADGNSDAALERAAGRLVLAHRQSAEDTSNDAALERATGRVALRNPELIRAAPTPAAPAPPAAAAPPDPPAAKAASAAPRTRRRKRAPLASAPAAPEQRPAAGRAGGRKQPPLSVAAAVFGISLAAGLLIGVRLLDTPTPEARVTSLPRQLVEVPRTPVPASAQVPQPDPIPVQINAQPWAEIYIDDAIVGVTPLGGVMLTPGVHSFEARFPDGRLESRTLEISAERRHVTFPADAETGAAQ